MYHPNYNGINNPRERKQCIR